MNDQIITALDFSGTFAFAVSGALAAADKKFDLFGALFLGFVTAIGGGTLRDMMLGNTPVAWLHDMRIFYIIIAAVIFTFLFRPTISRFTKALFLFDTIGISVFTIIGLQKGLQVQIHAPVAVMMGVTTAVMGGIIRDVLCNDIPLIFHKEIYATACLLGGVIFLILYYFQFSESVTVLVAAASIFTVRSLSVRYHWSLPKFK